MKQENQTENNDLYAAFVTPKDTFFSNLSVLKYFLFMLLVMAICYVVVSLIL